MCGQQSKGRTDKQASSWASTGQTSLGNHLIATHTLTNPRTHTHTLLRISHSPADRSDRWAAELTLCNLYMAKSTIISAFAPYLIDLAGVWCALASSQEGADG